MIPIQIHTNKTISWLILPLSSHFYLYQDDMVSSFRQPYHTLYNVRTSQADALRVNEVYLSIQ